MPESYAAALFVIVVSVLLGSGLVALTGRREWAPVAPAAGLALATVLAWLLVRLPGEGLTALIGLAAIALVAGAFGLPRVASGLDVAAISATGALTLAAVSLPFIAEGHAGILGTGFNVDMSQHLFTADWIATQVSPAVPLIDQGYPVGPHSLAASAAELSAGNLVHGFTGVTIAVPVISAMTAFGATARLGRLRGVGAAALVALPYLVASYVAQGAFKEVFMAAFVLAFAIWLSGLRRDDLDRPGWGLPGAVIAAGALYAYSGPGLSWLVGALGIWALTELAVDRHRALSVARAAIPGVAVAALALALLAAPEAARIADFGGSAGNVADAGDREGRSDLDSLAGLTAQGGGDLAGAGGDASGEQLDLFDDDLGNLFGSIPALEALGVWPSGDFRVEPGDGAVPAAVFYLGGLLGAVALGIGIRAAWRRGERAILAALAAAVVIWLAALAVSTPYTSAKALQMTAPLVMLVAVGGVLDPVFASLPRSGPGARPATLLKPVFAIAFVVAVAGSSMLALANAPVGPERYTAGISKLRERLTSVPVLALIPPGQLVDRHGADYWGWELRGSSPICVDAFPSSGTFDGPAPESIRFVLTIGGKKEPPFAGLDEADRRFKATLWENPDYEPGSSVVIDADRPTTCDLGIR